jgi:sialate O-acetylesterase
MKKYILFILLMGSILQTNAQIKLPRLISNGMILQRDIPLTIWGWAGVYEKVNVVIGNQYYQTSANAQGEWKIQLKPHAAGGPFEIKIKGSNEIILTDVLFGDVYVCSGQSNMELWMGRMKYKYAKEIETVNNSQIRQFLVPDKYDFKNPQKDFDEGSWLSANPKNILDFSGLAYFFAKEINAKYNIPVGIINTALGGSPAQAWISEQALRAFPDYFNEAEKYKDDANIKSIESQNQLISKSWYNYIDVFDKGIAEHWKSPKLDDQNWAQMTIPGYWADTKLGNVNGVVWFRKKIKVPASMVGKPVKLELGRIVDADSVFVNEQFIGTTSYQYPPRRYELANNVLHEGENEITIRVINNSGRGGFVLDKKYELTSLKDTIKLNGDWKYKLGVIATSLPSETFIRWKPLGLYNAMIAPLTNYGIKGFLWYQGEANTSNPSNYSALMQTLITDWRAKWNNVNLPFLYVQLPNFMEPNKKPVESNWAELRQQQFNLMKMPNTGMAVAIDLGDWNDIHPENKLDVAHRLALLAQKNIYNEKNLVAQGPLLKSMKVNNSKCELSFSEIGSGLVIKGGPALSQFQIAGADKIFKWAKAEIKNNQVVVWSSEIISPVYVRYAWADNPEGGKLYNQEGLPASPFSTIIY